MKLKTLILGGLVLSFANMGFTQTPAAPAASISGAPCSHKYLSEQEIEYNYKGRSFQLIGWNHHIQNDLLSALRSMQTAVTKSQAGDCMGADKTLQDYVKASATRLKESNSVIASLDSAYGKKQYGTIGIEHTPEEWQENFDPATKGHRIEMILSNVTKLCPGTAGISGDILRIYDPVYYFVEKMNNKKAKVEPLEDAQQKKESLKGVSGETLNFEVSAYPQLSVQTKSKIENIQSKIKMGYQPSDEDIRELVATELDPKMKKRLTDTFNEIKQVMAFVDVRNKSISSKMVKGSGNYALVIGNAHLKGIAADLDKLCGK